MLTCSPPQGNDERWDRDVDFVVSGGAFEALLADHKSETCGRQGEGWSMLEAVLIRGAIFVRMSSTNKQHLISCLMDLNMVVCM